MATILGIHKSNAMLMRPFCNIFQKPTFMFFGRLRNSSCVQSCSFYLEPRVRTWKFSCLCCRRQPLFLPFLPKVLYLVNCFVYTCIKVYLVLGVSCQKLIQASHPAHARIYFVIQQKKKKLPKKCAFFCFLCSRPWFHGCGHFSK